MENYAYQYSSHRGVAMVLALVSAVVLSPLYVDRGGKKESSYYETRWSCGGMVLPVLLAGLIVAIKSTSSSSVPGRASTSSIFASPEPSALLRIGSSSWGLAAVLVMLLCAFLAETIFVEIDVTSEFNFLISIISSV